MRKGIGPNNLGSPLKVKQLKKVVKQLEGASKKHAGQAKVIQSYIDAAPKSPAKALPLAALAKKALVTAGKQMIINKVSDKLNEDTRSPFKRKDACYHKVKARYDVFPSAYASGAIAKCRKVGAANYGKSSKKK
jgi:hypothetical protein|tara:strand:+ start:202 stop:603 length:402 start_codon:yes stop_codon:yes gene_type:complete